ncbi:filamentous hemagglutinin N-terminal domain-containing protein [Azospirillum canadense]|uniref:filamentous hemagglutinin N-terminal domain-containing protein n=1 Tax=Azospirillum canadense TaxID=403962 RepID=UPI002226E36D|nr:filamentous hemagglutinin N-terminal domain-containing protein [Azospirillum canadense]MCW2241359.1 filamentous hemagglutinin family protein [Azospirillum canadense]
MGTVMGKIISGNTPHGTDLAGLRTAPPSLRQRLLASATGLLASAGGMVRLASRRLRRAAKARRVDFGAMALRAVIAVALSTLFAGASYANPQGGTVTAGAASIKEVTPKSLEVTQTSDKAIINWKSFSVGADESVRIQQPSSSSVILNRVTGTDPSAIMGSLSANGTVMLVNPNGVVIGKGAKVDVGGLVATTANISDANFMAGNYAFDKASPKPDASVVNEGTITVKDTGLAALVAPHVRNSGVINAKLGKVALGGAQTFTLDFHGDGLISFDAGSAVTTVAKDADGKPVKALVVNSGEIAAEGGTVTLSARAVKGVIDNVINTKGVIKATSVGSSNGKIVLSGGDNGKVVIGGTVDAGGVGQGQGQTGQTGGTVVATGEKITVAKNAVVNASGNAGGGTIAIGSGPDRAGSWSDKVTVKTGARLSADALKTGKGGSVTVLSEKTTKHAGSITARGGAEGGDGGFAEVSSRKDISLTGNIDLSAAKGRAGTFLLDPATLRIIAGSGGSQNGAAAGGTIAAGGADQGSGNNVNTVSKSVLEGIAGNANIVLESTGQITVETSLALQTGVSNGFTLRSTGSGGIAFTDKSFEISTNGGSITLEAQGVGSTLTNIGKLTTRGGAVNLTANAGIQLANVIDTTPASGAAGAVTVRSQSGAISALDGAKITGGATTLSAAGGIGASGAAVATSTSQLTLETGGSFYVTNDRTLTDLSITSTHLQPGATNQFQLTSTGLAFSVTDGPSGYALTTINQTGGLNSLSFAGDRDLQVGTVNAGTGAVALTSTAGNITGTPSSLITGGALTLTAKGSSGTNGSVGTSSSLLRTEASSLTATAGTGGVNVINTGALNLASLSAAGASAVSATGTLTVGAVSLTSGAMTLNSFNGDVLKSSDPNATIKAGTLWLSAGGSVGTAGTSLTTNASTINATSTNGGIYLTAAGGATLGTILSTNGKVAITTNGDTSVTSLTSANGTSDVVLTAGGSITVGTLNAGTSGNVNLTSSGNIISGGSNRITGNNVTLTASGSSSLVSVNTAANRLTVTGGSVISVSQYGSVILDSVITAGGAVTVTNASGDITVGTITTPNPVQSVVGPMPGLGYSVTLTATAGSILGKDAGNLVTSNNVTMSASGAIGTGSTHLRTDAGTLALASGGDLYIDNTKTQLTSLTVANSHSGTTPNTLQLTSGNFTFTASDDGQKTTLSEISGAALSALSYTSDKSLTVGEIRTQNLGGTVTLKSLNGDILDDGNANTRVNGGSIALSAANGSIGAAGTPLGLNGSVLDLTTKGNLHVADIADLSSLTITSGHTDATVTNTYTITAPEFVLNLTDSTTNGYSLNTLTDATGLTVSFKGDRDIRLGKLDVTYASSATLETTNGSILDDGSKVTSALANTITLKASGAIGSGTGTDYLDIVAGTIDAKASNGGIYIDVPMPTGTSNTLSAVTLGSSTFNASNGPIWVRAEQGDITLGTNVSTSGSGAITLAAATGSILNPNGYSLSAGAGNITLTAGQALGTADKALNVGGSAVTATAGTSMWLNASGSTMLTSLTAGNDVTVSQTSGSLSVGAIQANAGTGTVSLNSSSGSIQGDNNSSTVIAAGKVLLSAVNGSINGGGGLNLTTPYLSLTTSGGVSITDTVALTDLSLTRASSPSGSISISTVVGQSFALSDSSSQSTLQTVTSTTPLNFSYSAGRTVKIGTINVGSGGSVTVASTSSSGAITNDGNSGSKITAGTVSLTAGSSASVGSTATGGAISLDTANLILSAGQDFAVNNNGRALSSLSITSTNFTTADATKSLFSIAGTGAQAITITDAGTKQTLDVAGSGIGDFSFTNVKAIEVSEIVATGTVSLTTAGGGANSSITSVSSGGRITANSVILAATGTVAGSGSIGTNTLALSLSTPSLKITNNGNIYVNNNNTALTTLDVTSAHKSTSASTTNSYQFSNIGSGRSFSVSDSGGVQTLALSSGSGTMNFAYSTDRAIETGTMDAGTSTTGSIALTSTGGSTGTVVAASINKDNGTITAGSVSLFATGSNSNIGGTSQLSTSTGKLAITSGGNVSVANSATLTDLTLDARHSSSGSKTYSITSTGLTFSVTDNTSGSNGFNLTNIIQSGLNLSVTADKSMTVTNVDVGAGAVTLTAGSTGNSSLNATKTSTVLTAGSLTMNASSIGNTSTSSNEKFYTKVGTLTVNGQSSLRLVNDGTLTLKGVTMKPTSVGGSTSAEITATNNGSILQSGAVPLTANIVKLSATGGSIGASGTPLLTAAQQLTLSSGKNVYLTNAGDLFSLDLTATHATPTTKSNFDIQATGLSFALTDTVTGSQYTLSNLVDATGLDFTFSGDVAIALGTVKAQPGHKLSITTTGTNANITSTGSSLLTAGSVTLTATGSIGAAGSSANHIQTVADSLTLTTGGNVFVDNALDLAKLSLTSKQSSGSATYEITAPQLAFTLTDDGTTTTVGTLTDATGIDITLDTQHAQSIGTIDAKAWGKVALTSAGNITGTASAAANGTANRITAGSVTLTSAGGNIGSTSNKIHLSAPVATFNVTGDLIVESDTHIEQLGIASTHTSNAARTYAIDSVGLTGGVANLLATDNGTQTTLTTLADSTGQIFSFTSDRGMVVGSLEAGTVGSVTLSANSGNIDGDGNTTTKINAGAVTLSASSGAVGTSGAGNGIEVTTGGLTVAANNGANLALQGATKIASMTLGGPLTLTNTTGDIALGTIDAGGGAVSITNNGGSILSGGISNTTTVSLTATGSIGNSSAITTSANNGGTTTLTASAAGSIAVTEGYKLNASSVVSSGGGNITLSGGSSSGGYTFSVGTISTTGAVSLTSSGNSIVGNNGSNLVTGGSVSVSTGSGSIGASGTNLNVATTDLTLKSSANVYVADTLDLAKLTIDRSPTSGTTSSGTLNLSALNLTWNVTDASNTTTFTNLTDTTGLNFSYKAMGSIVVGTINAGNSGSVVLQASPSSGNGNITAVNSSSTITAGSVTLSASGTGSAIGSSGTALGLNTGSLTASSGTGGLYIKNAGALSLNSVSTSGDLSATASTGDLTISGLSYGTGKALILTATTGRIVSGTGASLYLSGSGVLTAGAGIGTVNAPLKVTAGSVSPLTATVTGTGGLYLDISSYLSGGVTATAANGPIAITGNANLVLNNVGITTDAAGNDISVTTSLGDITVDTVTAGATAGKVSLTTLSGSGKILAASGTSAVSGSTITLNGAGGIGSSAARLGVNGDLVQATSSNTDIYLKTTGATSLGYAASGTGKIDVLAGDKLSVVNATTSGGAITIASTATGADIIAGTINAGTGAVSLTSGAGAVIDDGASATRITGGAVSLSGANGVGIAATAMQTTASSLTLSSSGVGGTGIFVSDGNTNGVTLASATATSGPVTVSSAGTMTVGTVSANTSSGAVSLTAAGSILGTGAGPHVTAKSATLTATGGSIGAVTDAATGAGTPIKLNVAQILGLTATGTTPVISVDNSNTAALSLTNNLVTLGAGGSAYIKTAGDLDASAGITLTNGNLLLQSGGTLTLPTAAINLGSGALTLKGTTDVIASGATPRSLSVTAGSLTFSSGSAGGNTTLNTTVGTLNATLTGTSKNLTVNNTGALTATLAANGDITATNSTAMTVSAATASGTGRTVRLTTTTGDLTVGAINAGATGSIVLSAAAGSILSGVGSSLTGNSLDLTTFTGVGTALNPFTSSIANIAAKVTGTGGIYLSGTSFTLGDLTTANGDIAVTTTGAISDANTVNGITAGSGGTISVISTGGAVSLSKPATTTGGDGSRSSVTVQGTSVSLGTVTSAGTQSYTGATTLNGNLTGKAITITGNATLAGGARTLSTSAANGNISITGTLAGGSNAATLTAGTGTVTLGGAASGLSTLNVTAGTINLKSVTSTGIQSYTGAIHLDGTYTTTTGVFSANGATTLDGATTVSTGANAALFSGTVDGAQALTVNSTAATQFNGVVGGTTALASLTTNAGGTLTAKSVTTTGAQSYGDTSATLDGTYTTGNGAFSIDGTSTLAGDTVVSTGSGAVTFTGTVNGAKALTVNSTGATQFNGAVGGSTALASLTTNAGGTLSLKSVTTTGAQSYGEAATLNGTYVTSNAAVSFGGAVTLAGDVVVNSGSGNVTFTGTVNGAKALTVNSTGATQFNGAVGGSTALTSLTTDAGGTTSLLSVTTMGAQGYGDATTLNGTYATTNGAFSVGGAATLAGDTVVNAGSGAVTFGGTVNGAQALTVNSTGATQFNGVVGGTTALSSLTTNAGGTLGLKSVTTTGAQSYGEAATLNGTYSAGTFTASGPVTLAGDSTVTATGIGFASTIDGAQALTLNGGTGAVMVGGAVGGATRLGAVSVTGSGTTTLGSAVKAASVTTDAGGSTVLNGGAVDTTGAQSYGDAVTLGADTVLTGSTVTLAGGADAATVGTQGLTIAGNAALTGGFGAARALKSLSVSGATTLNGGNVATSGAQSFGGAVLLAGAAETLTSGTGGIAFAATLDGGQGLTLSSGTGDVTFGGAIGSTSRLGALSVNSGGQTRFAGSVKAASVTTDAAGTLALDGGLVDTTGAQGYGERAVLGADTVLTGTTVTLAAGADAKTAGTQGLTVTGALTLGGSLGGTTALKSVIVTGATTLGADVVVNAGNGAVTFGGAVDGAKALTVNSSGATGFLGAVGGTTALTSLTTNAGGTVSLLSVTTTGAQSYGEAATLNGTYTTGNATLAFAGPVTLAGDTVVNSGSGNVTFSGTVDGAKALTVNSTGTTLFDGTVGGTTALVSLTTDAGGTVGLWNVTTTGAQSYGEAATIGGTFTAGNAAVTFGGPVTLAGDTTVNAGFGTITFNGAVDGAKALTANSTGAMLLNASVGGTTALTSLTTGTGYTSLTNVTTTGAQSYGGEASLTGTYTAGNAAVTIAGPVTLAGDVVVNAGSGPVTFGGAVDGAQALTVNSTGATQFNGVVGGTTALSSLTTNAGGTLGLKSVTTTGAQSYGEATTLNGTYTAGTFTASGPVTLAGGSTVTATGIGFASTIDGAQALTLNGGTGVVTLGGAVGGATRLGAVSVTGSGTTTLAGAVKAASVTTDAGGATVLNGGGVDTTAAQSYGDAVVLGADTVLTGSTVTLAGGADAATVGGQGLTIASNAALTGGFGTARALKSLSVSGITTLNGGSVVTTGAQSFGGAVLLAGAAETLTSGTGGIAFAATLDGGQGLTLSSGTGDVTFGGAIGSTSRLGALSVNSGGQTGFAGAVKAASVTTDAAGTLALDGGSVDTTGAQSYGERAVLGADTVLTGTGVTLAAGADAKTAGAQSLTVTGDAVLNGAVGGSQALRSLSISGRSTLNGGTVTTTAAQTYGGAVTLGADAILTGGTVSLLGGGDAATAGTPGLTVNGDAVLTGAFGSARSLRSVSVTGTARLNGGITTAGTQSYGGATVLGGDTVLTSGGGDLVFGSTLDAANRSSLTLAAGGSVRVAGNVGGTGLIGGMTLQAGNATLFNGSVAARSLRQTAAGGTTRFAGAVTVDGTDGIQLTGAGFTFDAPVTASAGSLSITNSDVAGTVTFAEGANLVTATGFTQAGGSGIVLPGSVVVTRGPITLGAVATLPNGKATITTDGSITMAGLQGATTTLTMASGSGGAMAIGLEGGSALQKINLAGLTVPTAGSAKMFGSIAGKADALAASLIDSPLRSAPYFINNTPWGPTQTVSRVVATIVVEVPVPSTPGVTSLFTGTMTSAGLTPNALDAFASPQVLTTSGTTPNLIGTGAQPSVLSTGTAPSGKTEGDKKEEAR